MNAMERDDSDLARPTGRAGARKHGGHVGAAAEVAVALGGAAVEPQPPVASAADDDELVAAGARRVCRLPVAEFPHRAAADPRRRRRGHRRRPGPVGSRRPLGLRGLLA